MTALEDADAVLDFWFGAPGAPDHGTRRRQWFAKDAAFDRRVADRFGALVGSALAGALDHWGEAPRRVLARILLLDQFTRNIHRGSARAFAGDPLALADALALLAAGGDRRLGPFERAFAYMPLEHAEDGALQARSVGLFEALAEAAPATADFARYARRHRDVIARFGRFPHRNEALGRRSSEAEQAFLHEAGSGF